MFAANNNTQSDAAYGFAAVTPSASQAAAVHDQAKKETAVPYWYWWTSRNVTPAVVQAAAPQQQSSSSISSSSISSSSISSSFLAPDNLPDQTARTVCKTTKVKTPPVVRSNNQQRLYMTRNAAKLLAIERRNAEAAVQGPRFIVGEAPHRPQGPHPHMYQSLHNDPLPLLGARSGVHQAYMERLRAIDSYSGSETILSRDMAKHIDSLVYATGAQLPYDP